MAFLIGVILLIVFLFIFYFIIRYHIKKLFNRTGLAGVNLKQVIEEARIEDQEVPKSISGMDSFYLEQIQKDFPSLNINELKRENEKIIMDCFQAIEKKDSSTLKGKMKSFVDEMIHDNPNFSYSNFSFHHTVISAYQKKDGVATITFQSNFQYYLLKGNENVKVQDRCRSEFIYVYDTSNVQSNSKVLGIHCPNCGAPITSLGEKTCSYCSSSVIELIRQVFTCNDIVRY